MKKTISKLSLRGKDLEDIAVQSLRCDMNMEELKALFKALHVKYHYRHLQKIKNYRAHVRQVTRSPALGY